MTPFIVLALLALAIIVWCLSKIRSAPPEFKGRNREFKSLLEKTAPKKKP